MRGMQTLNDSFAHSMTRKDTDRLADVARLLAEYEKSPAKADEFLEAKFTLYFKYREERQVCQFIFLTVLRNRLLINFILKTLLLRKTRPLLRALIECGAAEIIASEPKKRPQVIHAWVEACKLNFSTGESKVANAVLRRFAETYDNMASSAKTVGDFALLYSHPDWLAKAWAGHFGAEKAVSIMEANQTPADVFFRISTNTSALIAFAPFAHDFEKTADPYFFRMKGGRWHDVCGLLDTPYAYIQDPSTGRAPRMLDPKPGEKVLDMCAAPGGKSRMIADLLLLSGQNLSRNLLVSADLPGQRFKRLSENLSKIDFLPVKTLACDLLEGDFAEKLAEEGLPGKFDAILLDAPCSNTGVLRRRPDVRMRLKKSDISNCSKIQEGLIKSALAHLAPGGRLVYSTCSIEPEENLEAPLRALESFPDFEISEAETVLPGETDGAGMCLIKEKSR